MSTKGTSARPTVGLGPPSVRSDPRGPASNSGTPGFGTELVRAGAGAGTQLAEVGPKACRPNGAFRIPEMIPDFKTKYYNELCMLLNNGLFYQAAGNAPGALTSYSMAEVYLHILRKQGGFEPGEAGGVDALEQQLLGYIEVLTEKTKNLSRGGGGGGKSSESETDWSTLCNIEPAKADKTFDDVVGMAAQKRLVVTSFIKPLQLPNVFPPTGKGVLLFGPPGTGKTYFIKGMINQLQAYDNKIGVLYYAPTAADLKGKYVGETEKNIVKYFTCAARNACAAMENSLKAVKGDITQTKKFISILFIDEFDAVGGDRSADETGLMANSVNTLLQMMDGVQSFKNVTVIAATNYPWKLDAAILRRFNNQIFVGLPNIDDIAELLRLAYKDSIAIKSSNVGCYCGTKIDKSVFKATQNMDPFCGSTITENNIKLVGNTIVIRLPEEVKVDAVPIAPLIEATDEGKDGKEHWHFSLTVIGAGGGKRYTYEFVMDDVPVLRDATDPKSGAGAVSIAPPTAAAALVGAGIEEEEFVFRPRKGKSYKNKTAKRRSHALNKSRRGPFEDLPSVEQVGGAGEDNRASIIIQLDPTKVQKFKDEEKEVSKWFKLSTTQVKTRELEKYVPYKFFNHKFVESPILMEIAQIMFEKKYSNSDIVNVMTYVGQKTGESASDIGSYVQYNVRESGASSEASKALINSKEKRSVFDKEKEDIQTLSTYYISAPSSYTNNSVTQKIRDSILGKIDSTGAASPLGDLPLYLDPRQDRMVNVDDPEQFLDMKDTSRHGFITCITHGSKKYYNSKFVIGNDMAATLNDPAIKDIYIHEDAVKYSNFDEYKKTHKDLQIITRYVTQVTNKPAASGQVILPPNVLLHELWFAATAAANKMKELYPPLTTETDSAYITRVYANKPASEIAREAASEIFHTTMASLGEGFTVNYSTQNGKQVVDNEQAAALKVVNDIRSNATLVDIPDATTGQTYPTAAQLQALVDIITTADIPWVQTIFKIKNLIETRIGGNNVINERFLPKVVQSRNMQLFVVSKIDLNNPWFKEIVRSNVFWVRDIFTAYALNPVVATGITALLGVGGAWAAGVNFTALGSTIYGAGAYAAAQAAAAATTAATAVGGVVTGVAGYVPGLSYLALANPAVVGGIVIVIAVAAVGYYYYKKTGKKLTKSQEKLVEQYLLNTRLSPAHFLLARTVGVIAKEGSNYKYYDVNDWKIPGMGKTFTWFGGPEWVPTTLWDMLFAKEEDINPAFVALFDIINKGVVSVDNFDMNDSVGTIFTKLMTNTAQALVKDSDVADFKAMSAKLSTSSAGVEVKTHTYQNPTIDPSQLLNFYMNPAMLSSALTQFQSTYNPQTGGWLEKYEKDRNAFLEKKEWLPEAKR